MQIDCNGSLRQCTVETGGPRGICIVAAIALPTIIAAAIGPMIKRTIIQWLRAFRRARDGEEVHRMEHSTGGIDDKRDQEQKVE